MSINLDQLRSKFPAEYAAVFAAGREAGVAAERDRVAGHLRAAELSGARELATAAIRDGRGVEALSNAYLEAGLARRDQRLRDEDEAEVALAADGAKSSNVEAGKSPADVVADVVVSGMKYHDADISRIDVGPVQ